ncbi:MAG: YggS family pyridoxal phosphate-dependent enzyme [Planctomycetes bacterium]|nr:YggS family pyridoxal phosphate-dependent enzyme [Planctomycetota bacterium]
MPTISDNLNIVNQKISDAALRSGRDSGAVKLIAVAKTATDHDLLAAFEAGQRIYGHNRVQALEQHRSVLPNAEWHLLGPLQGKKVRRGVAACNLYQALGDFKTAERIQRVLSETGKQLDVLLQVNHNPSDGRYGLDISNVETFCEQLAGLENIKLKGLMNLATASASESQLNRDFEKIRICFEGLQIRNYLKTDAILSMGMSSDFEIAITQGANLVRLGRAIFPVQR